MTDENDLNNHRNDLMTPPQRNHDLTGKFSIPQKIQIKPRKTGNYMDDSENEVGEKTEIQNGSIEKSIDLPHLINKSNDSEDSMISLSSRYNPNEGDEIIEDDYQPQKDHKKDEDLVIEDVVGGNEQMLNHGPEAPLQGKANEQEQEKGIKAKVIASQGDQVKQNFEKQDIEQMKSIIKDRCKGVGK